MKTDLTIFFTLWNRCSERFDYFKDTVESFKKNIIISKYSIKWIATIESKDHILKNETEIFCKDNNIEFYYKPGNPNLGSNLNFGLSKCDSDFIFYLQDDWKLNRQINLDDDIDFLKRHNDIYVLRYWFCLIKPFDSYIDENLKIKLLDPKTGFYYCADNPHLKKSEYHKLTGPYYDKGDSAECENYMADRAGKLSDKYKISVKEENNYFQHIGSKSSMFEKQKK